MAERPIPALPLIHRPQNLRNLEREGSTHNT